MAIDSSTTPRFGPRCPPVLATASTRKARISAASSGSAAASRALRSSGDEIDLSSSTADESTFQSRGTYRSPRSAFSTMSTAWRHAEEVERRQVRQPIAAVREGREITRQCGRVTGDIDDDARIPRGDALNDLTTGALAGRVEDDDVSRRLRSMQEPVHAIAHDRHVTVGEVAPCGGDGARIRLDRSHRDGACRERTGEQADAAVEVEASDVGAWCGEVENSIRQDVRRTHVH